MPTTEGVKVFMPNGSYIISTHTCELSIPSLPLAARRAHLFKSSDLVSGSLLSIAEMCDAGLSVTYDKERVIIYNNDAQPLLHGYRDATTNLWMIDLKSVTQSPQSRQYCANVVHLPTHAALVNYWHAALGSPTTSTLLAAYDKGFINIPGLTAIMIRKHPPNSTATAKGHLDRNRQGQRSTKTTEDNTENDANLFQHILRKN